MNLIENCLTSMSEECAEVIRAASKIQRFGLADKYPDNLSPTTHQKFVDEVHDLMGAIEVLQDEGVLPRQFDRSKVLAKVDKIRRYQQYSRDRGILQEASGPTL